MAALLISATSPRRYPGDSCAVDYLADYLCPLKRDGFIGSRGAWPELGKGTSPKSRCCPAAGHGAYIAARKSRLVPFSSPTGKALEKYTHYVTSLRLRTRLYAIS